MEGDLKPQSARNARQGTTRCGSSHWNGKPGAGGNAAVGQSLKNSSASDDFLAVCKTAEGAQAFQCQPPARQPDWREYLRLSR